MGKLEWAIVGVFLIFLLGLVTLKYFKVDSRKRGAVKMVCSTLFVVAAILACTKNFSSWSLVLVIGVIFAFLGDLFLVFMDDRRWFLTGVIAFACSSLTLSVYSIANYGFAWWSIIVFVIFIVANVFCQLKGVYDFGRNIVYLNVYMVAVGLCGSLGVTLFVQGVANLPMFLFGLGCFAYFVSDVVLGLYLLKFRLRSLDIINSFLYFPGLMLIACSLFLI